MGCQRLMILTTFLLFAKDYEADAQYASVIDCLPQLAAAIARPVVQPAYSCVQPIYPGYDTYGPDLPAAVSYCNYGNYPAPFPGLPPIIIEDKNDMLHHLLYFLIFAMKNKKSKCNNSPPSVGGGCSSCNCGSCGSGNCGCFCGCPSCNSYNNDNSCCCPTYIPIPIAIPIYTGPDGCPYIEAFSGSYEDIFIQGPSMQAVNDKENNSINLIIRTDG